MGTHVWTNENQTGGAILPENFAQNVDEAFVKVWNQVAGFTISASGPTTGRAAYDDEAAGFVYYDSEAELFYQKQTSATGDWSDGFKVGTTKNNNSATADPGATDDANSGYSRISLWLNTTNEKVWICVDDTPNNAKWDQINAAGGTGTGAQPSMLAGARFSTAKFVEGETVTASTTKAVNDNDEYWIDLFNGLSDGNNVVDVSRNADKSARLTVVTANKKFGLVQFLANGDSLVAAGQAVSVAARLKASGITTLKMAPIIWSGTADSLTTNVVSAWNAAGVDPTLAANWAYAGSITTITATGSFTTTKGENKAVSASVNNLAFLIWVDQTTTAAGSTVDFEWLYMAKGTTIADEPPYKSKILEQRDINHYINIRGPSQTFERIGQAVTKSTTVGWCYPQMPVSLFKNPVVSVSALSDFVIEATGGNIAPTLLSLAGNGCGPEMLTVRFESAGHTANEFGVLRLDNSSTGWIKFDSRF